MFANREEAGRLLGHALARRSLHDPVVLALPRGGVPVAAEVARALHAPMDLLIVRKIGAPYQPELAVAAVAEGTPPALVVEESVLAGCGADADYVESQVAGHLAEIERRRREYLRGAPRLNVTGKTAVLVDDGLATGTTMRAALKSLRRASPARVVVAVPVGPRDTVHELSASVDELVCLTQPDFFGGVGAHYADFHQVSDGEVMDLLRPPADKA